MADATRKGVSQTPPVAADLERAENEHAQDLADNLPADAGAEHRAAADEPPANKKPDEEAPKERPINPRRAAFDEAVLARRKEVQSELVDPETMEPLAPEADGTGDEEGDAGGESEAPKEPAKKDEPAPAAGEALDMARKVKIKVYGEEREVSLEEVVRMAQRGEAAQKKFDEAERIRREAEEIVAGRSKPAKETGTDPAPSDRGGEDDAGNAAPAVKKGPDLRALAKALQFGDEEEAEQALRKLVDEIKEGRATGTTPAGLDEEKVTELVESRLARREAASAYQRDLETVGTEFPTIFNDPDLTYLAAQNVHRIRAQELIKAGYPDEHVNAALASADGQKRIMQVHAQEVAKGNVRPNVEIFREACTTVSKKFGGQTPTPPAPSRDKRVEEKRNLNQPPAARSARASMGQEAPKAPTRSDIVLDMRKARGQPA